MALNDDDRAFLLSGNTAPELALNVTFTATEDSDQSGKRPRRSRTSSGLFQSEAVPVTPASPGHANARGQPPSSGRRRKGRPRNTEADDDLQSTLDLTRRELYEAVREKNDAIDLVQQAETRANEAVLERDRAIQLTAAAEASAERANLCASLSHHQHSLAQAHAERDASLAAADAAEERAARQAVHSSTSMSIIAKLCTRVHDDKARYTKFRIAWYLMSRVTISRLEHELAEAKAALLRNAASYSEKADEVLGPKPRLPTGANSFREEGGKKPKTDHRKRMSLCTGVLNHMFGGEYSVAYEIARRACSSAWSIKLLWQFPSFTKVLTGIIDKASRAAARLPVVAERSYIAKIFCGIGAERMGRLNDMLYNGLTIDLGDTLKLAKLKVQISTGRLKSAFDRLLVKFGPLPASEATSSAIPGYRIPLITEVFESAKSIGAVADIYHAHMFALKLALEDEHTQRFYHPIFNERAKELGKYHIAVCGATSRDLFPLDKQKSVTQVSISVGNIGSAANSPNNQAQPTLSCLLYLIRFPTSSYLPPPVFRASIRLRFSSTKRTQSLFTIITRSRTLPSGECVMRR